MEFRTIRSALLKFACVAVMAAPVVVAPVAAQEAAPARKSAAPPAALTDTPYATRSEVQAFIRRMSEQHGFDSAGLESLFAQIRPRQRVVDLMTAPLVRRTPWYEYESRAVSGRRVDGGLRFYDDNAAVLARAREHYGVPEEIIVSIIGIETVYGAVTGTFPVVEALATLAFDYPRRAEFFRQELEHFLLLSRETGIDAMSVKGSFAGAIGIPQFMPSNYRRLAVDFDGDGKRDLMQSPHDAIGSVGNFLRSHGWRSGEAIMAPVSQVGTDIAALQGAAGQRKTVAEWAALNVKTSATVPPESTAVLISLETQGGTEYWLGFENFSVILRYNRSTFYATAVTRLAERIAEQRPRRTPAPGTQIPETTKGNSTQPSAPLPSLPAPTQERPE